MEGRVTAARVGRGGGHRCFFKTAERVVQGAWHSDVGPVGNCFGFAVRLRRYLVDAYRLATLVRRWLNTRALRCATRSGRLDI